MKSIMQKIILLSGFLLSILFTGIANAQFWEIPDPALPYIAKVRADPSWGYAVIYNSKICEQIGDACAFFRAHEYAHAFLNHMYLPPDAYPEFDERKADCWAAQYIKPNEALAAAQLFEDNVGKKDLPLFGDPAQRAQRIRECVKEKGVWIGKGNY